MVTWKIRHGDCRKWKWEGDVMIVDPPYSAHTHNNATTTSSDAESYGEGYAQKNDLGFGHLTEELRGGLACLAAKLPRWSVIFSDVESVAMWKANLEEAGATYIRTIPWIRWSMPQLSGDRPPQGWEAIILAYGSGKGKKHWNGPGNFTHFSQSCLRGVGKHKAEKPLDLMLDLVKWFSDEGETVIDPMCGSGTTGLACKLLKRHFVGCELQEEWAHKTAARLRSPELSPRDAERFERWKVSNAAVEEHKERMRLHTAVTRAKLEARIGRNG